MVPITKSFIFVAVLALAGCPEPLPLRVTTGHQAEALDELPDAVMEACELLEVACDATHKEYGSVTVNLVELDFHPPGQDRILIGGRDDDSICSPSLFVDPTRSERVAHELGHIFELEHVDDERNLMHIVAGDELNYDQLYTVQSKIDLLLACR